MRIIAVAVLALVLGFAISWVLSNNRPIELEAGTWLGEQARALPEFELRDHNNQPLTRESLNGKWNLIFFGYTHCPDICPTSLQALNDMLQVIDDPDVSNALRVYFVSVDPDRDKPEILASYVNYFNPSFTGATAQMDQLQPLTRSLGIAHAIRNRVEGNPVYDVDHSAAIVLVNPKAEFAGLFGAPHDAAVMARDMTRIVEYN
ncbi:MAG: SCO family protein [Gammaproteobacteria bacterium]|nr:SCO family protein [Gammaproteobacteria bacterium]